MEASRHDRRQTLPSQRAIVGLTSGVVSVNEQVAGTSQSRCQALEQKRALRGRQDRTRRHIPPKRHPRAGLVGVLASRSPARADLFPKLRSRNDQIGSHR